MSKKLKKKQRLLVELHSLQRMLDQLPKDRLIERASLISRVEELSQLLAKKDRR